MNPQQREVDRNRPGGARRRWTVLAAVFLVSGLLVTVRALMRRGHQLRAGDAGRPAATAGTDRPGGR